MKISHSFLAALVCASSIGTAYATDAAQYRQQEVFYGDLDLSSEPGAVTLYNRISRAAREVCDVSGILALASRPLVKECRQQALARAVVTVDAPLLRDYYQARNPGENLPATQAIASASVVDVVTID